MNMLISSTYAKEQNVKDELYEEHNINLDLEINKYDELIKRTQQNPDSDIRISEQGINPETIKRKQKKDPTRTETKTTKNKKIKQIQTTNLDRKSDLGTLSSDTK